MRLSCLESENGRLNVFYYIVNSLHILLEVVLKLLLILLKNFHNLKLKGLP